MRKYLLSILFTALVVPAVFAHPPANMEAEYVAAEGKLYIYMNHLSRDHRRHYIKKTSIFRNGEEVATELNRQQTDPNTYAFSIGLQAKGGDEIMVKAYCAEGGTRSTTLIVPAEQVGEIKAEVKESEVKAKVEGSKDKDVQSNVYGSSSEVYDSKTEIYESKDGLFQDKSDVYESKESTVEQKKNGY